MRYLMPSTSSPAPVAASEVRLTINPGDVAKRRAANWTGMSAEIVQFSGGAFEYSFQAPVHLLIACERAIRIAGETKIDGLPASTRRDFSGTMSFVPAGYRLKGSFVPRVLPRAAYFYLDPAMLPADPDADFDEVDLAPQLFFENASLWVTAAKLAALVENPDAGSRLYAEALGTVLAIEICQVHRSGSPTSMQARGGLAGWQRRIVCDYIEENLAEDVTLSDVAGLARLSPSHFCRAFKRTLGMPPHHYQIHRRIERAKTLLADPARSVTEIALDCGFNFPGNFATAFHKATGMTPSAFRRGLE
jgi:AraC family transcriptional regulator